jgi:hypothetical protein
MIYFTIMLRLQKPVTSLLGLLIQRRTHTPHTFHTVTIRRSRPLVSQIGTGTDLFTLLPNLHHVTPHASWNRFPSKNGLPLYNVCINATVKVPSTMSVCAKGTDVDPLACSLRQYSNVELTALAINS